MMVVERLQADYDEELDPFDALIAEEYGHFLKLISLIAATNSDATTTTTAVSKGGLQGKVANQLRSIGDHSSLTIITLILSIEIYREILLSTQWYFIRLMLNAPMQVKQQPWLES